MKVKKLFALVLAVAMIFALAIPAFADEAQPQGDAISCSNCGAPAYASYRYEDTVIQVQGCSRNSKTHYHTFRNTYKDNKCSKCGWSYHSTYPVSTVDLGCR